MISWIKKNKKYIFSVLSAVLLAFGIDISGVSEKLATEPENGSQGILAPTTTPDTWIYEVYSYWIKKGEAFPGEDIYFAKDLVKSEDCLLKDQIIEKLEPKFEGYEFLLLDGYTALKKGTVECSEELPGDGG